MQFNPGSMQRHKRQPFINPKPIKAMLGKALAAAAEPKLPQPPPVNAFARTDLFRQGKPSEIIPNTDNKIRPRQKTQQ